MTKPGYKMTEIGEIPEEWSICKFSEIAETVKGSVPKDKSNDEEGIKMYPYLSADYLRDNKKKTQYFKIDNRKTNQIVNMNEIILIWDGSNAGEFFIGKEGILSSTMVKLVFKDLSVMPKFAYYYMKTKEGTLKNTVKGSTIPHISEDSLLNLNILLPPMKEQQKIAEILSTADGTIQKVNEEITLTEKLKKGLMQILLTKGIGHTKFKMTEIGEIPEEWNLKCISECTLATNTIDPSSIFGNFHFHYIDVSAISSVNLEIVETKEVQGIIAPSRARKGVKEDDVIFATVRPYLKRVAIVPKYLDGSVCSTAFCVARADRKFVLPRFLYYYMTLDKFVNRVSGGQTGSAYPAVSDYQVMSERIAIPELGEQQKISEILTTVDNKLKLLGIKKTYLERIKKGLMNDLLTGKIRVNINTSEGEN